MGEVSNTGHRSARHCKCCQSLLSVLARSQVVCVRAYHQADLDSRSFLLWGFKGTWGGHVPRRESCRSKAGHKFTGSKGQVQSETRQVITPKQNYCSFTTKKQTNNVSNRSIPKSPGMKPGHLAGHRFATCKQLGAICLVIDISLLASFPQNLLVVFYWSLS